MPRPTTLPLADEIELSVFGPGYGEALAAHIGNGIWVLIDSCIHKQTSRPAALQYLESIGVPRNNIRCIVASHWHDDHVKGLAELVEFYSNAELIISDVFNEEESLAFLCLYSGLTTKLSRGAAEVISSLKKIADRKGTPFFAKKRTNITEERVGGTLVRVAAFSPTDAAIAYFKVQMASHMPKAHGAITNAPQLKPNVEAVVIQIQFGDDSILLGSDMEHHGGIGWQAITGDHWCRTQKPSSLYKVAHHGSITGHHDDIWSTLVGVNPESVLTPFSHGKTKLPKPEDRIRISQKSSAAYLSSDASRKPKMPSQIVQRLKSIATNITPVNAGFGSVHFRKRIGAGAWTVELDGDAIRLANSNRAFAF